MTRMKLILFIPWANPTAVIPYDLIWLVGGTFIGLGVTAKFYSILKRRRKGPEKPKP